MPVRVLEYYLCKKFGWLPSQIQNEDYDTLEEFIYIMNQDQERIARQNRHQGR